MNQNNVVVNQHLPGLLAETCGVIVDEPDSRDPGDDVLLVGGDELGGMNSHASVWVDLLELHGAESPAAYGGDHHEGRPAVTVHNFGQGEAVYVGTVPEQAFIDALAGWLGERCGGLPRHWTYLSK
jgi:beta-galactosidase